MPQVIYKDSNGVTVEAMCGVQLGHAYDVHLWDRVVLLRFQDRPVGSGHVKGLTNEALLATLIHRTAILDKSVPCPENKVAIDHMRRAFAAFELRTKDRLDRCVEGKNTA